MRLAKIASAVAGAAALALVVSGCGSSDTHHPGKLRCQRRLERVSAGQSVASEAQSLASSAVGSAKSEVSAAVSGAVGDSQVLTNAERRQAGRRHQVRSARPRPEEPGRHVLRLRRRGGQVRRRAARRPGGQHRVQGVQVRRARGTDRTRRGRLHRRDLLDHRHPQGEGQLRRDRTSSPPRTCWSSPTTPTSPVRRRWPARSCARSPVPRRRRR